jgi:diguanylate cyclase (GGDEF)-like protein
MKKLKALGVMGVLALLALGALMLSQGSSAPSFPIVQTLLFLLAMASLIALLIGSKIAPATPLKTEILTPPDTSGLNSIEDPQLSELLRAALYTLNASDISLFGLTQESSPSLQYTNSTLGSPVPIGFLEDVLRYRHTISTRELPAPAKGKIPDSRAVSIIATPIIDSNVVLGILAINSPKVGAFDSHIGNALEMFASQVARTLSTKRVQAATEDIMQQMRILHEESTTLVATLDLPSLITAVAEAMQRVDDSLDVSILLKTGTKYTLMYKGEPIEAPRPAYTLEGTLADMAVSEAEHKYFSTLKGYHMPILPDMPAYGGAAALIPLCFAEEVLGLAVLLSENPMSPRQVDSLRMLTEQAAISVKNALFHAEVKRQALTDGLTGLCNHKHFKQLVDHEIQSAQSDPPEHLTLIMLDIDHFKVVNDTFGHRTGDAVIIGIAELLEDIVRKTDLPARYGGEEFAAMLLDTDLKAAMLLAERLRKTIEETVFVLENNRIKVTASIGIATLTSEITSSGELIELADQALYQAKNTGRNKVQIHGGAPGAPGAPVPSEIRPEAPTLSETPTSIIIEEETPMPSEAAPVTLAPSEATIEIIEVEPSVEPQEKEEQENPLLSSTVGTPTEPGVQVHKPRKRRKKIDDDELRLF